MRGLIIAAAILALLFLLGYIPLGGGGTYDSGGATLWLRLGPVRVTLLPRKQKTQKQRKEKSPQKPERPQKAKPEKQKPTLGGSLAYAKILLPTVLECARRVWGAIYLNTLYLELQVGAEDPGEAAMAYGRANAVLGALWTPLVRAFRVKDGHARVDLDFDRKEPALYARAELSIRLGQALWLGLFFGLKVLNQILQVKNEKKQQQRKAA